MSRIVRAALVTSLAIGMLLAAAGVTTATRTTGKASFRGQIIAPAQSGSRTVVSSMIAVKGVFNGVGRIVEVPNRRGDADNVSRDDLVFRGGSMHLVSVTNDVSFSTNPRTCLFKVTLQQTGSIAGGTGRFANASGSSTATVVARGLLPRTADRTCSEEQVPLSEVDTIASTGTLSF
jgi:hypothetical protein